MNSITPPPPTNQQWEPNAYAADQPEYQPLQVVRQKTAPQHSVMSCWELTEEELAYVQQCIQAQTPVRIFLEQWTFRHASGQPRPLQPVRLWLSQPFFQDGPW
jgi:hypothetical protein